MVFYGWPSLYFLDLAITPSGELYAISGNRLFKIDLATENLSLVGITDSSGNTGFNSLVAIDDHWLLGVRSDRQLCRISTETGKVYALGDLGYTSLGDVTFFKGHYYMVASGNRLVRFDYNKYTSEISSVELVGIINTNNIYNIQVVYGLMTIGTTTCDSDDDLKLIAFEMYDAYEIDPNTAACTQICEYIPPMIFTSGATSIEESQKQVLKQEIPASLPNIFTPNGDYVNDFFEPQEIMWEISYCSIAIFNRWGNLVFEDETKEYFRWDGTTNNDEECPDGVYYYKVNLKGYCDTEAELTGFIQLIR